MIRKMVNMKIIGITGKSGAGKSTVCEILKDKYNVEIIDADKIARTLTQRKTRYLEEIINEFGIEILDEEARLDRKKLAEIIYSNSKAREKLNLLTFKYVVEEIKQEIERVKSLEIVVIDAPLLFESKLNEICDKTIAVVASDNIEIERICKRDLIDEQSAKNRLNTQLSRKYLIEHVDYIIENNGTIEQLEESIEKLNLL